MQKATIPQSKVLALFPASLSINTRRWYLNRWRLGLTQVQRGKYTYTHEAKLNEKFHWDYKRAKILYTPRGVIRVKELISTMWPGSTSSTV